MNLTSIQPGAVSALLHKHSRQDQCLALYHEAAGLALGAEDMAAVIQAIENRTRGGAA